MVQTIVPKDLNQCCSGPPRCYIMYNDIMIYGTLSFAIIIFKNACLCTMQRETLESVSSCTRFSCILKISNFGFNRSSSKLVSMFFGIVPMFVLKDFVQDCFVAQICAKMCVRAVIRAYLRDEAIRNKILGYEHWNYPKEHAYQF